ncbi:hypothetical protein BDR07DRAFT_1408160 [Suillus spraguei]|nr:hypothetical protein BDR07DRAFT_1408160 [Suillus spraguei]
MAYTIAVRTIDITTSDPGFTIVEKTAWYDAETWPNTDSIQPLVMIDSGTSGTLRFKMASLLISRMERRPCSSIISIIRMALGIRCCGNNWLRSAGAQKELQ